MTAHSRLMSTILDASAFAYVHAARRWFLLATMGLCACDTRAPRDAPVTRAHPQYGARVDTGHVAIEGGSLYYEAMGVGDPVILLHGGNLDRRMWDEQFELLRRTHHVVRYDARGYGRSSPAELPFRAHEDLLALLDGLHIERANLVGLSMGGRIALDFALTHPERVERMVLAAPGISGGTWADDGDTLWVRKAEAAGKRGDSVAVALAWLESAYIRTALATPERAAAIRQMVTDNASYWMGIVRHSDIEREADPNAASRLEQLRSPVLLVVGGRDTPFIADVARAIATRVPFVRRVDIPAAGHMLNLEASARFNRELTTFLAAPCPAASSCGKPPR